MGGVGLVVLIVAVSAILLAHGSADPPLAWADQAMGWASDRESWAAAPPEAALPVEAAFTLAVRARVSESGAAWGVWLEAADGSRVIYAIGDAAASTGEGYVTTRRCPVGAFDDIDACPALRPEWRWMPYPRVNPPGDPNTITLHREASGDIRLRLNRERLGAAPVPMTGRWGVWVRGGHVITWDWARLFLG